MFVLGVGGEGMWGGFVCVVKDKVKTEKTDYVIVHLLYFFFLH